MTIFSAAQVKEWDNYTIQHNPISSIDLMESAALACLGWLKQNIHQSKHIIVFCGKGNNGGDGLAIARLLLQENYKVTVFIPHIEKPGSFDFEMNLERLYHITNNIHFISGPVDLPVIEKNEIIIDALFATGLRNTVDGLYKIIIDHINNAKTPVISIDLPSGLLADDVSSGDIVKANYTLTFEQYKLALLMGDNEQYFGNVVVLPIGLNRAFAENTYSPYSLITKKTIVNIYKPRKSFSHKGTFGHAGIIAGSYGMMGAAVLCTHACVRSGAGKVTITTCEKGYHIMQTSVPEAMCLTAGKNFINFFEDANKYSAIGVGPGLGKSKHANKLLKQLFTEYKNNLVIDADGLNTLAENDELKKSIPVESILTPHPKEFDNLFGKCDNDFHRLNVLKQSAVNNNLYIILKGHHTAIATPGGKVYFNNTGNAGMAKGGSGDVLTGILTALLAQGYNVESACILGVYLHGCAGDIAAAKFSKEAMSPTDSINCIGEVFKNLTIFSPKFQ